ncbi:hypothetical protein DSO57_1007901 [Entomophthora muscae]|uniref:Uncharacterized protein n=1 Tax=Entomophthora muscae TaxID=34485 RepID=A0ACC2T7H7_9FUNG|nr:hypothetical protein DSO57_1007901 [Entomophthora muscae]
MNPSDNINSSNMHQAYDAMMASMSEAERNSFKMPCSVHVVNAAIYHVSILPSVGYFEDNSLSFVFVLQNESGSNFGSLIV